MSKAKVIVISGVTAGGKTTLIQQLTKTVPHSRAISFDDYNIDALPSAPSFDQFLENSKKAVNQYDISELLTDLTEALVQYNFIFIDFPFGYEHDSLKPYIDVVIYLKTPLDVALARLVLRDYANKSKTDILNWMDSYLTYARPIFLEQDRLISSTADHILDGTETFEKHLSKLKDLHVV
ncbi:nucleoside/nucleotide kinase family protein [Enterococcus sp. LJL120]